jgi:hypothetical protein
MYSGVPMMLPEAVTGARLAGLHQASIPEIHHFQEALSIQTRLGGLMSR